MSVEPRSEELRKPREEKETNNNLKKTTNLCSINIAADDLALSRPEDIKRRLNYKSSRNSQRSDTIRSNAKLARFS
ncbi:hypothetical protein YC2023_115311 [Brassica napus]